MTDKDTREDMLLLAELAEASGDVTLQTVGQAENLKLLTPEQVEHLGRRSLLNSQGRLRN